MVFESWLREFLRELKFVFIRIKQSPLSIIGASMVIFYIILALLAPILAPPGYPTQGGDPYKMPRLGFAATPKPPGTVYEGYTAYFGTAKDQWDIYYGCVWGTRSAFRVGIWVTFSALLIGLAIGIPAGYFGGFIDELVMISTDIFLSLPGLIFAMALAVVLYPVVLRMDAIMLALTLIGGASYARVVRGEIFRIKHENYVKAAEAIGYSNLGVTVKSIVRDLISPILIIPLLDIGLIVLITATLSFLGLGPPLGTADWGQLIAFSRNFIIASPKDPFKYWYTYVIPGLFLFTFILGWILLSDAFRDILDPIKRKQLERRDVKKEQYLRAPKLLYLHRSHKT